MSFEVKSRVIALETGRGVKGLTVEAYDADLIHDDKLGVGETDSDGACRIPVHVGFFSLDRPDVYLVVKSRQGRVLSSTRGAYLHDVTKDVSIEVPIPCFRLLEAGVLSRGDLPPELASVTVAPALRTLTLNPSATADPLRSQIESDLGGGTVLELLKQYMDALRTAADNQALPFKKLGKLFELGRDLPALNGHHYGVALGLRLSGENHPLSHLDNVVGLLWGATLQDQSPWVGKSFRSGDQAALREAVGGNPGPSSSLLGINHFNQLGWHAANNISFHALSWWLNLQDAPQEEKQAFGYDRNGGHFIAGPAPSVCPETPRQVLSLNYRWPGLDNRPPLSWLIDEMVQIADGLYLGQLLFASHRLLGRYDSRRPPADYAYQHMGYFALWNPSWNAESRRLFPFLEVPVTAPGMVTPGSATPKASRYRELKLDSQPPATCSDRVFSELKADLSGQPTIMHLLQDYSNKLQDSLDNSSPLFLRLQELFNRAAPVTAMRGFYRGALVSWHGAGLLDLFAKNTLDLAWKGFAGRFSTWTGKSFDPITRERLVELTDGFETGELPSTWGANTQSLRTIKEREVGRLMKLANIWTEPASHTEQVDFGYDVKNFFFIAHVGTSVNQNCPDKRIYQFNYRWPKLRTIVPDRFCIDELVQIADGLYLGQLMYATDWVKSYDPRQPPASYRYGMFGYFLLMEQDWHELRLRLGFDLDNV
jgi:hypothetical protein